MDLNEKMAEEIAAQLGLSGSKAQEKSVLRKFEGKSDDQLAAEILRLKEQLRESNISYDQQMAIVKKLMPMMDAKQKARLQKVIELLK